MKKFNHPRVLLAIAFIGGITLVSLSEVVNGSYGPVPGVGMVVLGAIWFTSIFAWVYATNDAALIKHKIPINHFRGFGIRFLVILGFSFVSLRGFGWDIVWLTLFQGALFWILFDIFLNLKRDRDWNYVSTWAGTSWLDKIFKGHWVPWMAVKLVLLIWAYIALMA